jgi:hypothetical protein
MLGDDSTDPNITVDDSGMSVVTVTATPSDSEGSLLMLVLFGLAAWWLLSED